MSCARHIKRGDAKPETEISTPDDIIVERVGAVISSWMTRNWSEVQEGAYPEMQALTRELQRVLRSPRNRSLK